MPVIAFEMERIFAEKNSNVTKDTKVENNMRITDLGLVPNRENLIKMGFEFLTEYKPDIGNLKINGYIFFRDQESKIKSIFEEWKKSKKLAKEILTDISNFILIKCNIKMLQLSQDINLPPHIMLPMIKPETKGKSKENYIG